MERSRKYSQLSVAKKKKKRISKKEMENELVCRHRDSKEGTD